MQSFDVPGTVEGIHEIDGITIIEYSENEFPKFRVFVDGEDTGISVNSVEQALIFGVAFRHEGDDTAADVYFMRMIGAVDEE